MNWTGRHVLVTGSAKRVGRAICERLLTKPIKLSAHYHHSKTEAEELVRVAKAKGSDAISISADLKDPKTIANAVKKATAAFGPVDILVNSASNFYPTPALECTPEQWDDLLQTNLKGQFFFAQACATTMKSRGGVIINICDVHASKPIRRHTPYAASKAGLWMTTRNLAFELAPEIRVNSISPGPVCLPEHYTPAQRESSARRTLLKRIGSPEDIAAGVQFLIENDYITAFDLKIDGGRELS